MFDKDSGLVGIWVDLIKKGIYIIDDVPELNNLKETVQEVLRT